MLSPRWPLARLVLAMLTGVCAPAQLLMTDLDPGRERRLTEYAYPWGIADRTFLFRIRNTLWATDTSRDSLRAERYAFDPTPHLSARLGAHLYGWDPLQGLLRSRGPAWELESIAPPPRGRRFGRTLRVGQHLLVSLQELEVPVAELWGSDGNPGNLELIAERVQWHAPYQGRAVFANYGEQGRTMLQITDGTRAGTQVITADERNPILCLPRDGVVMAGPDDVYWLVEPLRRTSRLLLAAPDLLWSWLNGAASLPRAVLFALRVDEGSRIYSHDRQSGETHAVVTLPGNVLAMVEHAGHAVFVLADSTEAGLWISDGTISGTIRIHDAPYSSVVTPPQLTVLPGGVLFTTDEALWATDGTRAGTHRLAQGYAQAVMTDDEKALALVADADGTTVLRSDAARDGSWQLGRFTDWVGASGIIDSELHAIGERVVFRGRQADVVGLFAAEGSRVTRLATGVTAAAGSANAVVFVRDQRELLATDGTPAGTHALLPAGVNGYSLLTRWGDRVVFTRAEASTAALGITDGTERGTTIGEFRLPIRKIVPAAGQLLLLTDTEVWASFGPESPPVLVLSGVSPNDEQMVTMGHRLQINLPTERWVSDGTPSGTRRWVGPRWPRPEHRAERDGRVFFVDRGVFWSMDQAGEQVVALAGSKGNGWYPTAVVAVGGSLLFGFADDQSNQELWISDGTAAGTRLLRELWPGPLPSSPHLLGVLPGGRLALFSAETRPFDRELWVTDATPEGTRRVSDLVALGGSYPGAVTVAGADAYFAATTPELGTELWRLPLRDLELAATSVFTAGCGPHPPASLSLVDRPLLGTTPRLQLTGAPPRSPALAMLSWHPTRMAWGECELRVGPQWPALELFTDAAGFAQRPIALPDHRALVGLQAFVQVVTASPELATSNGLRLLLGTR